MIDKSIREMFPDWNELELGMWSIHSKCLTYGNGHTVEIGLYREPEENTEYAGSLTLQVFDGDEVIFCAEVEETE